MNPNQHEQFVRHVETIKRKMPDIGRQLDHPLAAALYGWMRESPRRSRKIFNKHKPQRSGTVQRYQPSAFLIGRDKSALYDLWLTGVDTRGLIAIEVLLAIGNPWRRLSGIIGCVVWSLVNAVGFWVIFFTTRIDLHLKIITFLAVTLLMWMLYLFLHDDRTIAGNSIRFIQQFMEFRAFHLRDQIEKGCRQISAGCLAVVSGAFIGGVCIVGPALIGSQFETLRTPTALILYVDFMAGAAAAFIVFYTYRMQGAGVLKQYRKSCKECDELFARTVLQENDGRH